jgi:cytidylate kinase
VADQDVCVVAIDGPSGSGKSTVSRRLATAIGARYLDTGAMYRAVTWAVLDSGVDPHDPAKVAGVVERITLTSGIDPLAPHISVDGRPLDTEIRGPEVTGAVSLVAAVPAVREIIHAARRIVVEGRDIASVVAPDAQLKVYLTASEAERARRRSSENGSDVAATRAALARRDTLDSTRATDPLRLADDAIEVDTTGLDIDGVVAVLISMLPGGTTR